MIIFLKLKDNFPDSVKLKSLSFKTEMKKRVKPLIDRIQKLGGRQESLFQAVYTYIKSMANKKSQMVDIDIEIAYEFYLSLLACVEIDRHGKLEKSYFRVPAMIVFLSESIRNKLLYELNRNSHEEKVKSIFQDSELCQIHMYHLQQLSRLKTLSWWSSKSKSLANISFLLIVLINLILLFSISSASDTNFDIGVFPGNVFTGIIGSLLIFLSVSVYIFYIIENYPVILYEQFNKPKEADISDLPSGNKLQGTMLIKYYTESTFQVQKSTNRRKAKIFMSILLYPENIYNLLYIIVICVAWVSVFVYPFLLLDIVKRNENLRNILKAVTQNKRQLGLTGLLGLIIVYLFAVVGFIYFSDKFDGDCSSLLSCVASTLYNGVRAGGGIGDYLTQTQETEHLFG